MISQDEFVELITQNQKIIFKITFIYTDNEEDRKDLYQDIVLQLWKAVPSFRNDSKVSTWIYRIALNTAVSQIRRIKKRPAHISIDDSLLQLKDNSDTGLEEIIAVLYKQINKLNDLEKALILLYMEEKSHEEISEITGLSITNVGTRISRIKQKLKDNFFNN
jgi:RNA polymerase sigma-70 factor (ECF subfamily)